MNSQFICEFENSFRQEEEVREMKALKRIKGSVDQVSGAHKLRIQY